MKRFREIADYLNAPKQCLRMHDDFFITKSIVLAKDYADDFKLKVGMLVNLGGDVYAVRAIHQINANRYRVRVERNIVNIASRWSLALDYKAGTRSDILKQDKQPPILWLLYPITQDNSESLLWSVANPVFVFAMNTEREIPLEEKELIVDDVLQQLKELWLYTLQTTMFMHMFEFNGKGQLISHEQTSYLYYGNEDKEVFEFNTTAIELQINNLKLKKI